MDINNSSSNNWSSKWNYNKWDDSKDERKKDCGCGPKPKPKPTPKPKPKPCHETELCLEPFPTCVPDKWIDVPPIVVKPEKEKIQGEPFFVTARFKVTPPPIIFQPKDIVVKPKKVKAEGGKIWVKPPEVKLHTKYVQKHLPCDCKKDHLTSTSESTSSKLKEESNIAEFTKGKKELELLKELEILKKENELLSFGMKSIEKSLGDNDISVSSRSKRLEIEEELELVEEESEGQSLEELEELELSEDGLELESEEES